MRKLCRQAWAYKGKAGQGRAGQGRAGQVINNAASIRGSVQLGVIQKGSLAVEALGGSLLLTSQPRVIGRHVALPTEILLACSAAKPACKEHNSLQMHSMCCLLTYHTDGLHQDGLHQS